MAADLQVLLKITRHSLRVEAYDDPSVRFAPDQNVGIFATERQVRGFAHPEGVNYINADYIMQPDGAPQVPAQLLIDEKGERHRYSAVVPGSGRPG